MATVVHTVEIDRETVQYRTKVTMTKDGTPWGCAFNVRDDGWKLWIYRDTEKGPQLVDSVSWGADSKRTPDKASALEKLTAWAHGRYED